MKIISEKPYSYFLVEDEGAWFLTYMSGGPFEIDNCVKLNDAEIKDLKNNPSYVIDLMESFKSDRSLYEGRRVIPSVRPNRKKQPESD